MDIEWSLDSQMMRSLLAAPTERLRREIQMNEMCGLLGFLADAGHGLPAIRRRISVQAYIRSSSDSSMIPIRGDGASDTSNRARCSV
jgi:hypothetical protein